MFNRHMLLLDACYLGLRVSPDLDPQLNLTQIMPLHAHYTFDR